MVRRPAREESVLFSCVALIVGAKGDNYNQGTRGVLSSCPLGALNKLALDNKGKQRLGYNQTAVKQPKPYGQEGRGVEVSLLFAFPPFFCVPFFSSLV